MPNGARCRTARDAELRQMPKGARCQKARMRRSVVAAPSGVLRFLAFRAVRHPAPFGIPRPLALRPLVLRRLAVRPLTPRRSAFGAVSSPVMSWKYEIYLAPILLSGRTLSRPVGRVVVEVGYVRRPEARDVAVEQVALHRLTEPRCPARRVRLPARREHERAAERDVGA